MENLLYVICKFVYKKRYVYIYIIMFKHVNYFDTHFMNSFDAIFGSVVKVHHW